jgi:MFS family permease
LWVPFASVYGRRPVYLISLAIATVASWGSGACTDYDLLIVARAFSGFALAAGPGVGGGVIADLFFRSQRGKATGVCACRLSCSNSHLT